MIPEQVIALLQEAHDRARALKSSSCAGTDTRLLEILDTLLAAAKDNGYAPERLDNLRIAFIEAMTQWPMMLGRDLYARVFTKACCPMTSHLAVAA